MPKAGNPIRDLQRFVSDVVNAHRAVWFGLADDAAAERHMERLTALKRRGEWGGRFNALAAAARRAAARHIRDSFPIQQFEQAVDASHELVGKRMSNLPERRAGFTEATIRGRRFLVTAGRKRAPAPASGRREALALDEDRAALEVPRELGRLATYLDEYESMPAGGEGPVNWSSAYSKSDWAKKFGVGRKAFARDLAEGKFRKKELSPRRIMLAMEDLPAGVRAKAQPPDRQPK